MNLDEYMMQIDHLPKEFAAEQRDQIHSGRLAIVVGAKTRPDVGVIPQLLVRSYAEFVQCTESWLHQVAAEVRPGVILFRGQRRDYCDGIARRVIPTALRDGTVASDLEQNSEDMRRAIANWTSVLSSHLGVSEGAFGLGLSYKVRHDPPAATRFYYDGQLLGKLYDPRLLAVLKHYGFPTFNLDVTADAAIALWFALHAATRDSDGLIQFSAIDVESLVADEPPLPSDSSSPNASEEWITGLPSVYLFAEWADEQLIDLTAISELSGVAERPVRQSAWSLPFFPPHLTPAGDWGSTVYSKPIAFAQHDWLPRAVFKIAFSSRNVPANLHHLCPAYLFPKDDRIYNALLEKDVPFLAKYG